MEMQWLQSGTCYCIPQGSDEEVSSRSHRRRRQRTLGGLSPSHPDGGLGEPSKQSISPIIVLISEKEDSSNKIWLCRWSNKASFIQENRILHYQPTIWVHGNGNTGDYPSQLNFVQLLSHIDSQKTHTNNTSHLLFSLEHVHDQETGSKNQIHRRGILQREIPRSEWNHIDPSKSSYVLTVFGTPTPLISLTVRILECGIPKYSTTPTPLLLGSWKRRLCGTIIMYHPSRGITSTIELPPSGSMETNPIQFQITNLGSTRSNSMMQMLLFVILPSTNITIQPLSQRPSEETPLVVRDGLPTLSPGTPRVTQVLLQTIVCIHQKIAVPRSFLLSGPAGVGKTYSVRRTLELCTLPVHLVSVRGSELLQDRGNSSQALEKEFQKAAKMKEKTVILFLDECDALVSLESAAASLSTILDRVSNEWTNLIFVGATNRIDSLPGFLRRSGRIDIEIPLSPPNAKERAKILNSLLLQQQQQQREEEESTNPNGPSLTAAIMDKVDEIAELCVGYVPADLNALIRKATLLAKEDHGSDTSFVVNFIERAMVEVGPSALRDALVAAPPKITWDNIAGDPGGAKTALRQAIEWPRTKSTLFTRLGLIPPRGILLHGPPGCAKTTLARAAAGASGVAFLSLSPAEVYSSSYVGEAEAVVRRAFSLARSAAPCVLFFDEIDSIFGGSDSQGGGGGGGRGGSAEARVLSTFLNEMDGVDNQRGADGVLVLAATNRPWTLDSALIRPGRLGDKIIYIPPPDMVARRAILEMQFPSSTSNSSSDHPTYNNIDFDLLFSDAITGLMTGAELVGACQEAKMKILRNVLSGRQTNTMEEEEEKEDKFQFNNHLLRVLQSKKPLLSDPTACQEYRIFERQTAGK